MLSHPIIHSLAVYFTGMVYENHLTQYRYDATFLYPTSYVYDPSYTKTKPRYIDI